MNTLDFIKMQEGLKLKAYKEDDGIWTIGYGTTRINGKAVVSGMTITKEQAEDLVEKDARDAVDTIERLVKTELSDNQMAALTSFVYNIGSTKFITSTMLDLLNAKDFVGASKQFDRWIYIKGKISRGLVKRRKAEKELFLK
jgi:lysozyme